MVFGSLKREWGGWFGALKLGSAIEMARAESYGLTIFRGDKNG